MVRKLTKGRWLSALAVFAALAAAQGCSVPAVTEPGGALAADVRVTEDPEGGLYVTKLSCTFEAVEMGGALAATPVTLRVKWVASCGVHKSETFQFAGGQQTYMTTYSEAGGSYIGKTFWVEITWEDAEGTHRIESGAAECAI
jgi:hypothetical protein